MTSSAQIVHVPLGDRSYNIEIGAGTLGDAHSRLAALGFRNMYVVICDTNLEPTHAQTFARGLADKGGRVALLVVPAGEGSKSLPKYGGLLEQMLEIGIDRQTVVVALGGGVIGDLAGFVAASYARGLPFFQVPTTLLAMVDSSVGGKVGINLPNGKNMVGAFWQPKGVLIDTDVLSTLPDREYRAGLAEVVKYGVILDADFFAWLEGHIAEINAREPAALRHIIARSCELKADVVRQDEREETGLRAVLNYGHTFAHAYETLTNYQTLLHGEAVSLGMLCASRLAERLGRIGADVTARQLALLTALSLPTTPPTVAAEAMLAAMSRDKKAQAGKLRFVLPTRLGHVELVDGVDPAEVRAVL
jgi:3-dehydroquinate synthase